VRAPARAARPAAARDGRPASAAPYPGAAPGEARAARLARGLSVRAVVFGLVVLIAFALLFPSVRAYLAQRAELDRMAADLAAAEQTEEELRGELERWDDPAYVQAQARDRLLFVMPGETAYRVIDPEVVVETPVLDGGTTPEAGPALPFGSEVAPWYATIWESVRIAGSYDPDGVHEPAAEDDGEATDG